MKILHGGVEIPHGGVEILHGGLGNPKGVTEKTFHNVKICFDHNYNKYWQID